MKKRRYLVIGVSFVISAIVYLLTRSSPSETRISEESAIPSRSAEAARGVDRSERRQREPSVAVIQHERNLSRHEAGRLKDFILPHIEGKDVSLDTALRILKDAYQEACFRSREKPLVLGFSVRDATDQTISFSMGGKSFLDCLHHLAALAGLAVDREGLNFVLFRAVSTAEPAELSFEKNLQAMPRLRALVGQDSEVAESDWESLLRSAGFLLENGSTLTEGSDGFLVVKGSKAEIDRVKSALALATQLPNQLKFTEKLITTTSPLDLTDPILSDARVQDLLRSLAQTKGTELIATPSVTAREGQSATMEIIREPMTHTRQDWTGIRNTFEASRTGLKIVGIDRSENRPENPDHSGWYTETETAISPGDTHVQLLASRDGSYHYRLLTVTPIDATGRPLGSGVLPPLPDEIIVFADPDGDQGQTSGVDGGGVPPLANSVPGKAGFVFSPYNNKIVDVRELSTGTLVADPTYPAAERKFFRVP
jgi:hypothetical protein